MARALLVALALGLHVVGYMVQQPRISIVALFTGVYGLTGLAWGREWLRESFFPFCLFAFCVPLGWSAVAITFPLRLLVCRMVEFISCNVLAIDILRVGTSLMDPTGHYLYDVAAACSGIRSLFATFAVAIIYAMLCFRAWWKRGLLIASALPLAVFGNIVRMLSIIIAAEIWGQEGGNYVHEGGPFGVFSLLPYAAAFAGLLLLGHWLRESPAQLLPRAPSRPLRARLKTTRELKPHPLLPGRAKPREVLDCASSMALFSQWGPAQSAKAPEDWRSPGRRRAQDDPV